MDRKFTLIIREGSGGPRSCDLLDGQSLLIGRSDRADVSLQNPSASWEQATLRCEGGRVTLENLSASATQVNGQRVEGTCTLRGGEELTFGPDCTAQLVGGAGTRFGWPLRGAVAVGVGALAMAVVVAAPWRDDGQRSGTQDWSQAFHRLEAWLEDGSTLGNRTPAALQMLREAHRQEQLGNHARAAAWYGELHVLLMHGEAQDRGNAEAFVDLASRHPEALLVILGASDSPGPLDDERKAAAFFQYVRENLAWNLRQEGAAP